MHGLSSSLPEDLSVFSLQWIHGRGDETFLAIGCHNADAGRAGAHVARAGPTQLSAALSLVSNSRYPKKSACRAPPPLKDIRSRPAGVRFAMR